MGFALNEALVFIGGLQRSGTTLLGRILASHPSATGLVGTPTCEDEGQFVQSVYLDDHKMGSRRLITAGRVARWAYHPRAHLTGQDALAVPEAGKQLLDSWRLYSEHPDAPFLVEKSPSNLTRTLFLQEIFPDARFVIIRRHPFTQALAVRKWADYRIQAGFAFGRLIDHWLHAMRIFDADRTQLSNYRVVAFEDLLSRPRAVLDDVCAFLGWEPLKEVPTAVNLETDTYASYLRALIDPTRRERFEPLYSGGDFASAARRAAERIVVPATWPRELRRLQAHYREPIRAFGYEPEDFSRALPFALDRWSRK